jgi:hypothetical protein
MNTIKSFALAVIVLCRSLFSKEKVVTKSALVPLKLNLQYFSQDPGDPPADPPADPPSEDEPFATFKSKDEFDKRLTRAERKGQKELAKALGYDSVEAMQEALKKPDEPNNKDKDKKGDPVDVDRLVEEKLKAEREKTFTRLRNSEVKIQAKELGFADWEDALALADLSEAKEDDKGNIVGVKEALEELTKKKPHLLKQKSNSFGGNIPNSQNHSAKSLENIKNLAKNRNASNNTAHNPWA